MSSISYYIYNINNINIIIIIIIMAVKYDIRVNFINN